MKFSSVSLFVVKGKASFKGFLKGRIIKNFKVELFNFVVFLSIKAQKIFNNEFFCVSAKITGSASLRVDVFQISKPEGHNYGKKFY